MKLRDSFATASLIACAIGGCAAQTEADDPAADAPAEDEPLDMTVDSLDIVHGALRLTATMVDGAADVSVRTGGDCEHREIGGGISTLSRLVWSFGDKDLAAVLGCGLTVRARVQDGAGVVNKVAELGLVADIAAADNGGEGTPLVQSVATSEAGVVAVFAPVTPGTRLATGDSLLVAESALSDDAVSEDGKSAGAEKDAIPTSRFTVPALDFVRSVLRGRPLTLDGSSFVTSLSVGSTSISGDTAETDEVQAADEVQTAAEVQTTDETQSEPQQGEPEGEVLVEEAPADQAPGPARHPE